MVEQHRLILAGYGCEVRVTKRLVRKFLKELTTVLGMHVWKGPFAWEMDIVGKVPGISGAVMWHESGVQLHHYEPERTVTVDIYSCKAFGAGDAWRVFLEYFEPRDWASATPTVTGPKAGMMRNFPGQG